MNRHVNSDQKTAVSLNTSAAIFILSSFYTGVDAAHDSRCSYSLADESMGTIGIDHSCVYRRNEFFWQKCLEKYPQRMPNMNVLIAIGATAAFVYSLYGTLTGQAENYMFYETTATIITLGFSWQLSGRCFYPIHTKGIKQTGQIAKSNGQYDRL